MPEVTQEQITAFENGARAMEALRNEILPLKGKFDAFDEKKYDRIQEIHHHGDGGAADRPSTPGWRLSRTRRRRSSLRSIP